MDRLREEPESRYVTEMLRILGDRSPAPLTESRPPEDRIVGTCRDFAVLHCALLRATGTPARVRCGYARYFGEGFHDDHWVTEYRLPDGGWRLVDAQLADGGHDVPFDPMDVPRDQFLVADAAWRACRSGGADPATFGVGHIDGLLGLWMVRGNMLRDLAALHGVEVLPWDCWGIAAPEAAAEVPADELDLLDALAAAHERPEEAARDALARFAADPRLALPREIISYTTHGGVRKVTLPIEE
ncbi:transglutaminase-like domain-containing protein [Streptomyces sp. NPDC091292]|uniref:transglutaminase-like domain-containing protein n=1 Tax=Streptomyces sp. NPDC091292 TaxID=3365991 RepID=UPI0037F2F096